jgi:6-phosphofructokinase 1
MGRHCGDIAIYAGIAGGAEIVLIPERDISVDEVVEKVASGIGSGKLHSIIIRAEGYPVESNDLIKAIRDKTGQDVKLVVLSYLQRGGSPTLRDRILATECGVKAVELLKDGIYNRAVGEVDGKIQDFDLGEALASQRPIRDELLRGIKILSM